MPRVLLVDDDPAMLQAVDKLLTREGYTCRSAQSAQEARRALAQSQPDSAFELLVLDVGLPDQDGFSLCRQIRTQHRVPILLLTARSDSVDKVIGLELGADDYLTKPFDPRELIARIRALLRRASEYRAAAPERIQIGDLLMDVDAREVSRGGHHVPLTEREFELLHFLTRHRGKALASDWIFESVWGLDAEMGAKTLAVTIGRLRQKIEKDPERPQLLVTLRGFGYRLDDA